MNPIYAPNTPAAYWDTITELAASHPVIAIVLVAGAIATVAGRNSLAKLVPAIAFYFAVCYVGYMVWTAAIFYGAL